MIYNITLLALNKNLQKSIAKKLAKKLGMFFVDVNDLIKYELEDIEKVISIAGIEYYNKVEHKIVKSVCGYENAVISINIDTLNKDSNIEKIKQSSLVIFLKTSFNYLKQKLTTKQKDKYENEINISVFEERNKILSSISNIIIDIDELSDKKVLDLIVNEIIKFYENRG